jgi:hypothetical protein
VTWSRNGIRCRATAILPQRINHASRFPHMIDNTVSARRPATSLLPHPSPISTAGVGRGWGPRDPRILRCDEGNKGNAACAALPGWNRLRIATDVVGVTDLCMPVGCSPVIVNTRDDRSLRSAVVDTTTARQGLTEIVTSPSLMG